MFFKKLFVIGAMSAAALALPATAALADQKPPPASCAHDCTPPPPTPKLCPVGETGIYPDCSKVTPLFTPPTGQPIWHPGDPGYNNPPGGKSGDPGNQCQQGNTWKGGDIKTDAFPENGCCPQDNHGDLKFSDGNCDPAPPCNQGWDQKNFNQQHNWDSTCYPVVVWHAPKPAPKPCKCDVQTITFDFAPNLHAPDGTWLLETGGPALHDGETLSYDGGTWTVEQWDPHGNGSLGNDKPYFVLTNGHDLSGGGHSTQFAHTICSSIHPLFT